MQFRFLLLSLPNCFAPPTIANAPKHQTQPLKMSTTKFIHPAAVHIPYPYSRVSDLLIAATPSSVKSYVEKSPIAHDLSIKSTEPVHISSSTPPSTSNFPVVTTATADLPTNGRRVHFTYVETIPLAFGLTSKVYLTGWYAAPDVGGEGYFSIVAQEGKFAETRIKKVKTLKESEGGGGAEFWEELGVESCGESARII
ncbi:hypothetical protein C7212DRAFT_363134 [Tuber magnatum]|uniref:Uncharacterized protein n=1 Tax=Tuber magnatum TaxID=42249 RepID=A0A317SUM3_9PEZI|nr:hypothetical protein C7212DRAFT_363134 [Tuber magnatum]